MEVEWHIPSPAETIEQGDILLRRDLKTGSVDELLMVMTADCDISQNKFGAQLACLRLTSLEQYIRTAWAERKLRRLVEVELGKVSAIINKWNATRLPGAGNITDEVVLSWIKKSAADVICKDLLIPDAEVAKPRAAIDKLQRVINIPGATSEADTFSQLTTARMTMFEKTQEECAQELVRQAQGESLPEDIFLLPDVPQVDFGPTVVMLRWIVPVAINRVHFRAEEASSASDFLRIGRMNPTFKYAISQAFGVLYSRIGLSESYETRCKEAIQTLSKKVI